MGKQDFIMALISYQALRLCRQPSMSKKKKVLLSCVITTTWSFAPQETPTRNFTRRSPDPAHETEYFEHCPRIYPRR